MASTIKERVEQAGLTLPTPPVPGGNYSPLTIRGGIGYVAIQFPIKDGVFYYQGKLGNELSTNDGYLAMQICALNVLAIINEHVAYDKLEGINHIYAYYRSAKDWDDAPLVVNGASDLFNKVLQDKGVHSRSLLGIKSLPKSFGVGLTATFTILK
ncbi:RidA family protein [Arenibacter algicola]|uniref:RidA family protein n=1 Tax=Arenibacter TaxID=178469 RepID=UPI001C076582|nr:MULTISPECIES: RidA family protein [Arenibacter]MBU2905971.1 RidA family protein [Arenibacter algicola]MDO6602221.1 RidA family protein [Arenibacter palladensis]|tara:strand:+ start:2741 stop:3205 length:465 start_codon:yes stop_codon:yes gene_type:complete